MSRLTYGVDTKIVVLCRSDLQTMDRRKQIARQLRIGFGIFLAALMLTWASYACHLITVRTKGQVAELSMVR